VTVGVAGTGLGLLGAAALLPVLALATPFLVAFVVLRAAIQAPLSTINYDLGARGARSAGVAIGAAMGMLNLVWALAAATSPLVTGALVDTAGARWVFLALAVTAAAAGLWMRRQGPPRRAAATGDHRPRHRSRTQVPVRGVKLRRGITAGAAGQTSGVRPPDRRRHGPARARAAPRRSGPRSWPRP
jgi:MFS family permease